MKNIGHYILISIACISLGFMLGIFVGRGTDGQTVDLIPADLVTEDALAPNFAYRDESVGRVDINTASVEELTTVPGIGKTTAQRIVEYRTKYGPFFTVDELLHVKGIGEGLLEQIDPYIIVGG